MYGFWAIFGAMMIATRHGLRLGFFRCRASVLFVGLQLLADVSSAHAQQSEPTATDSSQLACLIADPVETIQTVTIDRSSIGLVFHGGDGEDRHPWKGPGFVIAQTDRYQSFELLDIQNGYFDTLAVMGDFVTTADHAEVEVVSDWFDTVVLDPYLDWTYTADASFSGRVYRALLDDQELSVRVPFDTYVVDPPVHPLRTSEGPLGARVEPLTASSEVPTITPGTDGSTKYHWAEPGIIAPDLTASGPEASKVTLNFQNNQSNAVVVDLEALPQDRPVELLIETDALDRLIVRQLSCWRPISPPTAANISMTTLSELDAQVTVVADRLNLLGQRIGPYTIGKANDPKFRHLSIDAQDRLDVIDLKNEGHDVLMLRIDPKIRENFPVLVTGDPGLDEVWIEGTTRWLTEYTDKGVMVSAPLGATRRLSLLFAPGLKVHLISRPDFIDDPRMLEASFYPGIRDEYRDVKHLVVTRGGFVRFSPIQLSGKTRLDLMNQTSNVLHLSRESFSGGPDEITLIGDPGLDVLELDDLPVPEIEDDGTLTWIINWGDAKAQHINARGFKVQLGLHAE